MERPGLHLAFLQDFGIRIVNSGGSHGPMFHISRFAASKLNFVITTFDAIALVGILRCARALLMMLPALIRDLPKSCNMFAKKGPLHKYPKKRDAYKRWKPRPSDVVICVPPKSGTTCLMHIAHQASSPTYTCMTQFFQGCEYA